MLITNGKLITWEAPNRILESQAVYIADGMISEIGVQSELIDKYPREKKLDANGQYLMPGNICAHTHFYGAFARGMSIPGSAPKDFPEVLKKVWWRLDKSLTLEDVKISAQLMLIDAIKNGTTTLIDHHASPNAIDGSLDVIAGAVEESGARVVLSYEVTDRDGKERAKTGIAENIRFLKHVQSDQFDSGRIGATFGLHASLTLSDETLTACRQIVPDGVGFHIHVAEHEVDQYDSINKSGLRVVDRLNLHGILGPHSIIVHAVHTDARELQLLAESGTWVTHQPRSNMNNGVGVSQVESMMRMGIPVCIGTDGFSHTMWEEWKTVYLVHKLWNRDPRRMSAVDVTKMGAYNNSALASKFFTSGKLGTLEEGAYADLIFVDYQPFTPLSVDNLPWHMIFGFNQGMVTTTIVDGKILMHNRKLITMDEEEISVNAQESAKKVWKKYQGYAS